MTIAPDAAGQPAAQTYPLAYDYYLDGRPKTETYPSGKVVETQYDAAGRVAGVRNRGGGYYAGGDPSVPDNQDVIKYTSHGAVSELKLGSGLWERASFNARLQPEQLYLGSAAVNNSVLSLDYTYGAAGDNGNLRGQTITAPALGQDPAFAATQSYSYDSLNRLSAA